VLGVQSLDIGAILAQLPAGLGLAVMPQGADVVVAIAPDEVVRLPAGGAADPFGAVDALAPGWWTGFVAYESGRHVEAIAPPGVTRPADPTRSPVPDLLLARFDARLVLDAAGDARLVGDGRGAPLLAAALDAVRRGGAALDTRLRAARPTRWYSTMARGRFVERVNEIVEAIHAGDVYQVNLTRQLRTPDRVDPVALFRRILRAHPAAHRGLFVLDDIAVVGASPERYLAWHDDAVETRPIKGTARDAAALAVSAKDRAENVMIVDLARNDLGRIAVPGSVDVPALCAIESHPGLHHLVSTVRATRRPGISTGRMLRSTFPPASITGAPKPSVMQHIATLEDEPRGVYCGAFGWLDTREGTGDLAVAIRTFVMQDGVTSFGVGAGITADSDPDAEWEETELKAERLIALAGGDRP
jgi:para-aminobenzoate synthetase component 1